MSPRPSTHLDWRQILIWDLNFKTNQLTISHKVQQGKKSDHLSLALNVNYITYKIASIYWKPAVNSNLKITHYESFKNMKSNVLYLGNMFKL